MENVTPAIQNVEEKMLRELSPQEFQQMLNCWFQEKGIVQDMKSYLKFQMVSVLKNTTIGKNIRKSSSQTYTLAQQALHLIVAEYLLFWQCQFTLSLFTTEVNLTNIVPENKLILNNNGVPNNERRKFDKENIINILELIGIPKENQNFKKILDKYFASNRTCLLSCLLSLISKENSCEEESKRAEEFSDDFMKNIQLVLQSSNLPAKTYTLLLHNLQVCYELKTKSYESQVLRLVNKFKTELDSHKQKILHSEKRRRHLERRLLKLKEENHILQVKIDVLSNKQKLAQTEKSAPLPCSMRHCTEECRNILELYTSYKKELEALREQDFKQKEEINRLSFNYKELLKEFNTCQSKINLVNTRLQGDIVSEFHIECSERDSKNISLSSDSITEEILQQTRRKLKLLEKESEELDIRISNFVVK